MSLIVVGDIHNTKKSPKKEQAQEILKWIFNPDTFNNSNNILLLLGDLVENIDEPHDILQEYIDYFLNKSYYKSIYILQGNHDASMQSSFLSAFKPLPNVYIIQEPTILFLENSNILALPYYYHEGTDKVPMIENYSVLLAKQEQYCRKFDFVFHHVEDETMHYNDKFCDLSWIKTKQFLCGHIHIANVQEGGRFLGSVTLNSSAEKGKKAYIAIIENKEHILVEVPKFLEYKTVEYPQDLPEVETPYTLWTITESLDRQESIDYYTEKAKQRGEDFFVRKVISRNFQKFSSEDVKKNKEENITFSEYFSLYEQQTKLNAEVISLCKQIINNKEKGI